MNFAYKSILELKEMIENKEVTSKEVWDYFLARAQDLDTEI